MLRLILALAIPGPQRRGTGGTLIGGVKGAKSRCKSNRRSFVSAGRAVRARPASLWMAILFRYESVIRPAGKGMGRSYASPGLQIRYSTFTPGWRLGLPSVARYAGLRWSTPSDLHFYTLLFPHVDHVPDGPRPVVGDEEGAVGSDGYADGTAPDIAVA